MTTSWTFSKEVYDEIQKLPPKTRTRVLRTLGAEEWEKCKEDPLYWLDPKQHAVPYVYTWDPKPLMYCNLCNKPEVTYPVAPPERREYHLNQVHNIVIKDVKERDQSFTALKTIRPFVIKEYMPPIVEAWQDSQFFIIEKSRDMMATWLMVVMFTWDVIFHAGKQHLFQSQDGKRTLELMERVEFVYDHQPEWLKLHKAKFTVGHSKTGIFRVPTLKSEILGFPQGPDQIRAYHPSGVFVDEAAFQEKAGAAYAAIKPAIMDGGKYVAISTPNPGFFQMLSEDRNE